MSKRKEIWMIEREEYFRKNLESQTGRGTLYRTSTVHEYKYLHTYGFQLLFQQNCNYLPDLIIRMNEEEKLLQGIIYQRWNFTRNEESEAINISITDSSGNEIMSLNINGVDFPLPRYSVIVRNTPGIGDSRWTAETKIIHLPSETKGVDVLLQNSEPVNQ